MGALLEVEQGYGCTQASAVSGTSTSCAASEEDEDGADWTSRVPVFDLSAKLAARC